MEHTPLTWMQVRGRVWSEVNARAYRNGHYNAIIYGPAGDRREIDAARLPGLRGALLAGDIGDDSAIFTLPHICHLTLENSGSNRVDFRLIAGSLRSLTTSWQREGVESLSHARGLQDLTLDRFTGADLQVVSTLGGLSFLRLDVRRGHPVAMTGLRGCAVLDRLYVEGGTWDPSTLELPASITEITFDGSRGLDLGFTRHTPDLRRLTVENCGAISTVRALDRHPSLEYLSLWNTRVDDGDSGPLLTAPRLSALAVNGPEQPRPKRSWCLPRPRRARDATVDLGVTRGVAPVARPSRAAPCISGRDDGRASPC